MAGGNMLGNHDGYDVMMMRFHLTLIVPFSD